MRGQSRVSVEAQVDSDGWAMVGLGPEAVGRSTKVSTLE